MNQNEATKVIVDALELARSRGAYSFAEGGTIGQALAVIFPAQSAPVEEKGNDVPVAAKAPAKKKATR